MLLFRCVLKLMSDVSAVVIPKGVVMLVSILAIRQTCRGSVALPSLAGLGGYHGISTTISLIRLQDGMVSGAVS